jgi:putative MATE family efflux protein
MTEPSPSAKSGGGGGRDRVDEFVRRPHRAVWIVAAPMMVGFTVHAVYAVVDAAFIGQLGHEALAAATYVGALFFVAISLTNGLATGVTALVARAFGRRDRRGAEAVASGGLGLGLIVGVSLAAVGLAGGRSFLPLLGAERLAAELAWEYFEPICFVVPLFFVTAAIRSVLAGEGDARTPMVIMVAGTLVNLLLDPLFIFSLGLGIRGAAYATAAAQLFALSLFVYVALIRRRTVARFRLAAMLPRREVTKAVVSLGLPATAGHLVMAVGMALNNRVLSEFGQRTVAGYGAGNKVDMIVALPVLGLSTAAVTVVGIFSGAGRADLVRRTTLYTYGWALAAASLLGVGAYLASGSIVGLFTDDAEALSVGTTYLAYAVFVYPLMSVGMTSGRILQGLGRGMPTLAITSLRVLGISIPLAYAGVYLGEAPPEWIWISFIIGALVADVIAVLWVKRAVFPGIIH